MPCSPYFVFTNRCELICMTSFPYSLPLSQIVGFFSYIPLLGTLVRYVFELGLYYQGYYFYTSAS